MNGYDISNNQGDINNGLVPGDFVIIKATEGIGWTDPNCDANYQQSLHAGKRRGVYHYARPDGNDPIAEANWFVSQVKGYVRDAVFVLDLETEPITVAWAKKWLDRVFELTGVRPWLYVNKSTAERLNWAPVMKDYALWVAYYGANTRKNGYGAPGVADVAGDWTIAAWQYTSNGRLPNWGGNLDLNIFYGDAKAWDEYAGKSLPQVPVDHPPVPEPTPIPAPDPAPQPKKDPTPVPVPIPPCSPSADGFTKDDRGTLQAILKLLKSIWGSLTSLHKKLKGGK